jgi:tetratricopeptide (TPR) repeat protein
MKLRLALATGLAFIGTPLLAQSPTALPPAPPAQAARNTDIELVERLLAARRDYQASLEQLRAYYVAHQDLERARWAEDELREYHRINKYAFRLELDVPPPTLHAQYNIPEANDLYRRAMAYKGKGFWGTDYRDNQKRAEILFQQLLTKYPQSDKIAATAYQLGDIYESSAYHQYRRAAWYFERCVQWNPTTQMDARLRAARIYDHQLHEQGRAVELYKEITVHGVDPKQMDEASKRITELTGGH